jgi:hypothetical protein
MSMKNSNDTIGKRSRELLVCSAVPQPLRHRVPSVGGVSVIKMFQGQIDINVVEDSCLLGCDAVLLAVWFDHLFKLLAPPQNISIRLHAPLHPSGLYSPSGHFIDNSTAFFSDRHKT